MKKNEIIKHIKWKYIPFNLLKIELEITIQKNKSFEGNERKKNENERTLKQSRGKMN
jgi:hypothetical protein